jgi:flavin reductase (NADH)
VTLDDDSKIPKAGGPPVTARQRQFREAMARLAAAIHVVTTDGLAGRGGITASAVCSVSDEPPTVLVCINRKSAMNAMFKQNRVLAINTLRPGHEDLSAMFAGQGNVPMADRFARDKWSFLMTGSPVLKDALLAIDGKIVEINEVGTHSVFFVEVLDVALHEDDPALVYYQRGYRHLRIES